MPIYEIKNPDPPFRPETAGRESPLLVDGIRPVIRVRHYQGGRRQQEPGKQDRSRFLAAAEENGLRQLVERVNGDLERQNVPIHLVLVTTEDGFSLEVYDCTDKQVCRAIRDLELGIAELPALLRKLQSEAGLLLDTLS